MMQDATSVKEVARLRAVCEKESCKWLQVLPSEPLGTVLDNATVRIASALRLGANICEPHTCRCGTRVELNGFHGLSCRKSGGRYSRHNALNQTFAQALATVQVHAVLEPVGMFHDDRRPDGLTTVPWVRGRPVVWDVTVADTLANSYVDAGGSGSGRKRGQGKREVGSGSYRGACRSR